MIKWFKKLLGLKVEIQKEREWMLWIGDGMSCAGPHLMNMPVNFEGKKGKVVDYTDLKILVEWEDK